MSSPQLGEGNANYSWRKKKKSAEVGSLVDNGYDMQQDYECDGNEVQIPATESNLQSHRNR